MRRFFSVFVVLAFIVSQLVAPVVAYWFFFPAFTLAVRVAPMAAGLMTRGTTWIAGSLAADAAAYKIGETVAWAAGSALYAAYLMQGTSTSPQTSGGAPLRAVINLKPNDKRANPDPSKWDDATAVDPTPKATLPASSTLPSSSGTTPSTYTAINSAMTSGQLKQWTETNGSPRVVYKVTTTANTTAQSAYLNKDYQPVTSGGFVTGQWVWLKGYTSASSPYDHLYNLLVATSPGATRSITTADLYGCGAGYTYSAGQCNLTDATQVQKADMPCEIVEVNGSWTLDTANPTCTGSNAAGFTVSGTSARMNYTDGTSTSVARNTDGGLTIIDANPTSGTTTLTTGPFNTTHSAYPVTGVNQSAPGTGANGSGGSCGGTGQVPCAIDTSGFTGVTAGVSAAITGAGTALDDRKTNFDSLSSSPQSGDHGITRDGLFNLSLPTVTCAPLQIPFSDTMAFRVNFCDDGPFGPMLSLWRWVEATLLSWVAMWYLWRRFTRGATGESTTQ